MLGFVNIMGLGIILSLIPENLLNHEVFLKSMIIVKSHAIEPALSVKRASAFPSA